MGSKKEKTVRISFFELMTFDDQRWPEVDWQERLSHLDPDEAQEISYNGRTLDGKVFGNHGDQGLSLSIDRLMQPRERQRGTGVRKTMRNSGEDFDAAEETAVRFFPRNVFGMLTTGPGAPSHAAVAAWLSAHVPVETEPENFRWKATPITREDVYESVIKKRRMTITEATFKLNPRDLTKEDYGNLGLVSDIFFGTQDGFSIKITFQAGKQRPPKNVEHIANVVDNLVKHPGTQSIKVKAKEGEEKLQEFDLLEDRITEKVDIPRNIFRENYDDFLRVAGGEIDKAFTRLESTILKNVPPTK